MGCEQSVVRILYHQATAWRNPESPSSSYIKIRSRLDPRCVPLTDDIREKSPEFQLFQPAIHPPMRGTGNHRLQYTPLLDLTQ